MNREHPDGSNRDLPHHSFSPPRTIPIFNRYYSRHFQMPPFGHWLRNNHRSIMRALPSLAGGTIMEVGCGDGRLSQQLARHYPNLDVLAIDNDPQMVTVARRDLPAANLRYDLCDFHHAKGTFDLVVAAGCWEFFERQQSIARADALLAEGGVLVLNTVACSLFARMHALMYTRVYRIPIELHAPLELVAAFRQAGFRVTWEPVNRLEGSYTLVARRG